jgi:uncharacterized membrane protein
MTRYLSAYFITAIVFFGMDFAYLSTAGVPMFRQALGDQLATPMRAVPAVVFYLLFIVGLVFFAVAPAFDTGKWTTALLRGAALGFTAYATYELTNYATLARWTPKLVFFDLTWGTIVSGVAASIGYALASRWTH